MSTVKTLPDTSDEQLVKRLANGDIAAFQAIYSRYSKKLYAIAYSRTRSVEITEEIIQDIFVMLWEHREKIGIHNVASYLATAVKHDVLDHFKHLAVREKHNRKIRSLGEPFENTTEQHVSFEELSAIMEKEVNKLPEKCRIIFKLSREEAQSSREIAAKLDISPKTVDNQINKATNVLRLQLSDYLAQIIGIMVVI